jgi:alanine dehydrogenase
MEIRSPAVSGPGRLAFGFPRMAKEAGERRDFLPALVGGMARLGCPVVVEAGLGRAMGYTDQDYLARSNLVRVGDREEALGQDVVVTLRAPEERFASLRPGATLVSMLHFPTRPGRILRLAELGVEAISMDSITDDDGRRLVENMRAVGWNGVEAAFDALASTYPELTDPGRGPIRVTVLGAGTVGKHAIEAATKYGSLERNETISAMGLPGVEVTVVGRNLTGHPSYLVGRLAATDVLVDASQRSDPSVPLIPNAWLGALPSHAVICDLVVDPYLLDASPPTVRSIEGIPQGNLDQWVFHPGDPAWEATVPRGVPSRHRRTVVSCYSWPGVHPEPCMLHYGRQLAPLLTALVERGGVEGLRPDGGMLERALRRASLRSWRPTVGLRPRWFARPRLELVPGASNPRTRPLPVG